MKDNTYNKQSGANDQFKSKLKEFVRKVVKEMTTTAAVGGGDGSAGPIKTPNAFGKTSKPTIGTDYKVVDEKKDNTPSQSSNDNTSNNTDKKSDGNKSSKKDAPKQYVPITKTPDELELVQRALKIAQGQLNKAKQKKKGGAQPPQSKK